MKKILSFMIISLFLISFAYPVNSQLDIMPYSDGDDDKHEIKDDGNSVNNNVNKGGFGIMPYPDEDNDTKKIGSGTSVSYNVSTGIVKRGDKEEEVTLKTPEGGISSENSGILITNNIPVIYSNELYIIDSELVMETSVGQKQIILPEKAMENFEMKKQRIIEIKLREQSEKPVYSIREERQGKILGLFSATSEIRTDINAENGDVIKVKKPWWSFLMF